MAQAAVGGVAPRVDGPLDFVPFHANTEPERMFHEQRDKSVVVTTVPGALNEIKICRRYLYDECAMYIKHKIKWSVRVSETSYVGFTLTIAELAEIAGRPYSFARKGLFSSGVTIEVGGNYDHGFTFLKVGSASAEWGDRRIGCALVADIRRVVEMTSSTNLAELLAAGPSESV